MFFSDLLKSIDKISLVPALDKNEQSEEYKKDYHKYTKKDYELLFQILKDNKTVEDLNSLETNLLKNISLSLNENLNRFNLGKTFEIIQVFYPKLTFNPLSRQ
jgi:hypothetical protein